KTALTLHAPTLCTLLRLLSRRIQHIDLPKARHWTPMTHGISLCRFAFAVIGGAINLVCALATQTVAGVPEIGRAGLISPVTEHVSDLAVFDFPKCLAAELKVVALLIDGPTAIAVNQNAILNTRCQVLERDVLFGRLE